MEGNVSRYLGSFLIRDHLPERRIPEVTENRVPRNAEHHQPRSLVVSLVIVLRRS